MKKSAMVSTAEKYALEIEIFTLNRGFLAQISRRGAQKRFFSGQYAGSPEGPTFSTESADLSLSGAMVLEIKNWEVDPSCANASDNVGYEWAMRGEKTDCS
ncbi:hypothetical protein [Pseudomonas silesiensis]